MHRPRYHISIGGLAFSLACMAASGVGAADEKAPTPQNFMAAIELAHAAGVPTTRQVCLYLPRIRELPGGSTVGVMTATIPGLYRVRYATGREKDPKQRSELALLDVLSKHLPISRHEQPDGALEYRMNWSSAAPVPVNNCIPVAELWPKSFVSAEKRGPGAYVVTYTVDVRRWLRGFEAQEMQDFLRSYQGLGAQLREHSAFRELTLSEWGWRSTDRKISHILRLEREPVLDFATARHVFEEFVAQAQPPRLPPGPCLPLPVFSTQFKLQDGLLARVRSWQRNENNDRYIETQIFNAGYPGFVVTAPAPSRFARMLVKYGVLNAASFAIGLSGQETPFDPSRASGGVTFTVAPQVARFASRMQPTPRSEALHCLQYADGFRELVAIREAPLIMRRQGEDFVRRIPSYLYLGRIAAKSLHSWMREMADSGEVPEALAVVEGLAFSGRFTYVDDKWTASVEGIVPPTSVVPYGSSKEQRRINDAFLVMQMVQAQLGQTERLLAVYRLLKEGKGPEDLQEEELAHALRGFAEWRTGDYSADSLCGNKSGQLDDALRRTAPLLEDPLLAGAGARARNDIDRLRESADAQCREASSMLRTVKTNPRFDPVNIRADMRQRGYVPKDWGSDAPIVRPPTISGRSYSIPPPPDAPGRSRVMDGR